MKDPKILIAAPIGGKKQYSIFQWFSWIANQDYQNFEVALCANGTEKENLIQINKESDIQDTIAQVIKENPGAVRDFKNGKKEAIKFLVGQIMKKTKGKANPEIVNKLLNQELEV